MRYFTALVALAMTVGLAASATAEDDPEYLSFYGGGFDIFDDQTAAVGGVEWRSDFRKYILTPMAGGFVTTDGGLYGYGGVFIDVVLTDNFVIRPSAAVGAYSRGSGKDLGGTIEFRTAIEAAWRFDNQSRLGVEFSHISNAGIYDHNPGTETLTVNYSVPIGSLF